ncbi:MAG TPA: M17 family peptidase N-terminal domain-containing protein, partial [Mesorhizobium sp.]
MPSKGAVFVLSGENARLSEVAAACDPAGTLERAFPVAGFTGKFAGVVEVLAPQGVDFDRLVAIGTGKAAALDEYAWLKLGGTIAASLRMAADATVVLDAPDVSGNAEEAAALAAGILLRSYRFDKYKTRKDEAEGEGASKKPAKITIQCADPGKAKKA